MSTRVIETSEIIGAVIILVILSLLPLWGIWQFYGEILVSISVIFVLFISVSLIVYGAHKHLLRRAEAAESMVDEEVEEFIDTDQMPVLDAEDVESKIPALSCPDCGYKNPEDADFCIRCGCDLDVTDDVARY